MQERLKNALTAIGFCMLALVMTSVFATTVKAETNAELKNRVYEEVLNVSAKYCYITHELRLHQNDRCKRFTPV